MSINEGADVNLVVTKPSTDTVALTDTQITAISNGITLGFGKTGGVPEYTATIDPTISANYNVTMAYSESTVRKRPVKFTLANVNQAYSTEATVAYAYASDKITASQVALTGADLTKYGAMTTDVFKTGDALNTATLTKINDSGTVQSCLLQISTAVIKNGSTDVTDFYEITYAGTQDSNTTTNPSGLKGVSVLSHNVTQLSALDVVVATNASDGYEGTKAVGSETYYQYRLGKGTATIYDKYGIDSRVTATAIAPYVTITDGSTTLVEGTDYTVTGATSVSEVSTGNVILFTGKGKYSGSVAIYFDVLGNVKARDDSKINVASFTTGNKNASSTTINGHSYAAYSNGATVNQFEPVRFGGTYAPTVTVMQENNEGTPVEVSNYNTNNVQWKFYAVKATVAADDYTAVSTEEAATYASTAAGTVTLPKKAFGSGTKDITPIATTLAGKPSAAGTYLAYAVLPKNDDENLGEIVLTPVVYNIEPMPLYIVPNPAQGKEYGGLEKEVITFEAYKFYNVDNKKTYADLRAELVTAISNTVSGQPVLSDANKKVAQDKVDEIDKAVKAGEYLLTTPVPNETYDKDLIDQSKAPLLVREKDGHDKTIVTDGEYAGTYAIKYNTDSDSNYTLVDLNADGNLTDADLVVAGKTWSLKHATDNTGTALAGSATAVTVPTALNNADWTISRRGLDKTRAYFFNPTDV